MQALYNPYHAGDSAGKTVISTLDLKNGYWQILLDEVSSRLCISVLHLVSTGSPGCHLASSQQVRSSKNKTKKHFQGIPGVHI